MVLDWGCGRGADADYIMRDICYCDRYDPHYQPDLPTHKFDTVLCTYVLCTIPEYHDRAGIIEQAWEYLAPGGWMYVTVRADKSNLQGWTCRKTWQGYVGDEMERGGFTLIHKTSGYEIWGVKK